MSKLNISDNTAISMPMRNLISIIGAVAVGVWAYFGVIERVNNFQFSAVPFLFLQSLKRLSGGAAPCTHLFRGSEGAVAAATTGVEGQ